MQITSPLYKTVLFLTAMVWMMTVAPCVPKRALQLSMKSWSTQTNMV